MNFYIRVFKSPLDAKPEGWFHEPGKAIDKLVSLSRDLPDDQIVCLQITFSNAKRYNCEIAAGIVNAYNKLGETIYLTSHITRFIQQQLNPLTK